jgi:hexosaminidase
VFVYGGKNQVFSWSQMAFVAPLQTVRGDGLKDLTLH